MFVDASVIVAILAREPGYLEIVKRLADIPGKLFVSPLVKFEATVALARLKSGGRRPAPEFLQRTREAVEAFVEELGATEVEVSAEIGALALDACAAYGKAVGHPADLNFGDCFAYACARSLGVGLLYKGDDFARTDLA